MYLRFMADNPLFFYAVVVDLPVSFQRTLDTCN